MDDDEFGDDDLDAVADDSFLNDLEQRAFTSTQKYKPSGGPAVQQKRRIQTFNHTGLQRNSNQLNKNGWRPPQPRQQPVQSAPPASAPEPPSSDYGFGDEDVIDLDEPSIVIQSTSGLPTRERSEVPGTRPARYSSRPPLDPETEAAFAAADAELGAQRPGNWSHAPHLQPQDQTNGDVELSSLQARIAELEAEQSRLRQSEQDARNAALAKQGEIAIVRANQEKASKEYERRIAVMQKLHGDENAKQKAELELGRKEREKMETDNRFLQHDLAQEADRAKRLTGPGKARLAQAGKEKETPKKAKRTISAGDGFDDEEVGRLISPSKSKEKSREQTPKAGNKRKRPVQDSPAAPLSFTQQQTVLPVRENTGETLAGEASNDAPAAKEDDRYAFMQRLLNHGPYEGHERTIEALTKYTLPSDPNTTLSSLLLNKLSSHAASIADDYLPLKLSRAAIDLWRLSLSEKSYAALYLLLDLVNFALTFEPATTVAQLLEDAVPPCIRTIELVANETVRTSMNPNVVRDDKYKAAVMEAERHIDVDEVLDFLQRLCDAASVAGRERLEEFWRTMDPHFIILLLNKAHPLCQLEVVLSMLCTSVLDTSFGCIPASNDNGKQERDLLERLTSLLFEMPEPPKDEPPYTAAEIAQLRLAILEVLKKLCTTSHGGLLLAQYRSTIGRLIRFLDAQVCRLYTTRPTIGRLEDDLEDDPHILTANTINTTVLILHHLLTTYAESIDFQQKTSAVKGGYHKFLVSMTRIAFSDRLVLEEGIEESAVEAAHAILDAVLSPEEGDAVCRAVETPRGTRGTTTERDSSVSEGELEEGEKGYG